MIVALVCRSCAERIARMFSLGSKASQAVAEELRGEKAELERRVADAEVECERLTEQVEEFRDRLHIAQRTWAQVAEQTSALHALATQVGES